MKKLLPLLLLTGCAAQGPVYSEAAIPKGEGATLVVYRNMAYLGNQAGLYPVHVNGKECRLHPGSFFAVNGLKGESKITASSWDAPGTSKVTLNVQPNKTHYVRMDADNGRQVATVVGGLAAVSLMEASNPAGPFILAEVSESEAKRELASLKQDCLQTVTR